MRRFIYLIFAGLAILGIASCEKKSDTSSLITKTETLSMGAGYANDIYYRLSDGLTTSVPRTNWDIAFSVSARESSILINSTSGVTLKAYPVSEGWLWETPIDTTGYYNWDNLLNSDTTWMESAFNMNATGHPNYGWGVYDANSHNIDGVSLYIIKTRTGSFKRIWIEKKLSVAQTYNFRYSDLDGTNEQIVSVDLTGKSKNFVSYSLETDAVVDREPETDLWDIVFTKWVDLGINYTVTGALQNAGVTAQESMDTDPLSEVFPANGYLTSISTIGSDWKSYSMAENKYVIDDTRVFFVKDRDNNLYRIMFKTFEGTATGNISFDISTIK